ncbi:MAG: hypothetical protein Q9N26_05050 [Aquificota bacterium]|nr:hypothetical protein [Aquificota bacterium]
MWLIVLALPAVLFGKTYCVEVERDPYRDPYLGFAVLRTVERAVVESGNSLGCGKGSRMLRVRVVSFREVPIAFTPDQRVSAYSLYLTLRVEAGKETFTLKGTVPYSQPTGGLGDIPRRRAIDDILDKLYLNLLEKLRGGGEDADKRRDR